MATTLNQAIDTQPTFCCTPITSDRLSTEVAQQLTDDLSILAHPIRLQILGLLARSAGDVCVCDLEATLPVKQPTVSHHLRLLREAGLIVSGAGCGPITSCAARQLPRFANGSPRSSTSSHSAILTA